jgi:hypothetical protein
VLQVPQSAVDDAGGTAGYSRSEIILFDEQRVFSGASTLPRHSHAIDAAPDNHDLKVLTFQRSPLICC